MTHPTRQQQIAALEHDWAENPRWKGIQRIYAAADVVRLRGSVQVEHTLARRGAFLKCRLAVNGIHSAPSAAPSGCEGTAASEAGAGGAAREVSTGSFMSFPGRSKPVYTALRGRRLLRLDDRADSGEAAAGLLFA